MPPTSFTNTFAGNPLDRASDHRGDADWLAARLDDAGSRAVVLWNGAPMVRDTDDGVRLAYITAPLAKELDPGAERLLFLGLDGEAAVFALDIEGAADPAEGTLAGLGRFDALRDLAPQLPLEECGIAATAKAVFEWRRRHRFCSACGQPSLPAEGGWKRVCPACATEHFPRTDPVVIMLPVYGDRCLLGRQSTWPAGRYSALAGFLEPGESIEEACARELKEEAGLKALRVAYHSSQPWPYPTNLMIGLIADVAEGEARPDQTELEAVRWFTRAEARSLLEGTFDDLSAPPPLAIAYHLIRTWAAGAA